MVFLFCFICVYQRLSAANKKANLRVSDFGPKPLSVIQVQRFRGQDAGIRTPAGMQKCGDGVMLTYWYAGMLKGWSAPRSPSFKIFRSGAGQQ